MPFIRRFTSYPSDAILKAIEAVNIIDLVPPGNITGVNTGVVACVGQFLRCGKRSNCFSPVSVGNANTPTEVTSTQEMLDEFGGWSPYSNPGGAAAAPGNPAATYDGNGFLAIRNKKFARLVLVNVGQATGTATVTLTTDVLGAGFQLPFAGKIPAGIRLANAAGTSIVATTEDIEFGSTAGVALAAGVSWVGVNPPGTNVHVMTMTGVPVRQVLGAAAADDNCLAPERTGLFPGYTLDCTAGAIVAAMTEASMVTSYTTAINVLLNDSAPANAVSIAFVARHPITTDGETLIKTVLKQHVIDASAKGQGRVACASPNLGLAKATAEGAAGGTVGVGNVGLSDRLFYCYPGIQTFIPELPAAYITAASNGRIDWPSDASLASILSQLNPEENPGQQTDYMGYVLGIETGVTGLTRTDYENFRAYGICAPRVDAVTGVQFQSGVTSISPTAYPSLVNIARRRMADYIQDSIAARLVGFQKMLNTQSRRDAIGAEIEGFMAGLLSRDNPAAQRIQAYRVDVVSGNTQAKLAQGIFIILLEVQTLSSLDFIVLQTTIGESVVVQAA